MAAPLFNRRKRRISDCLLPSPVVKREGEGDDFVEGNLCREKKKTR
jgi:hypothetical protein